jgi:hypothetical protein
MHKNFRNFRNGAVGRNDPFAFCRLSAAASENLRHDTGDASISWNVYASFIVAGELKLQHVG